MLELVIAALGCLVAGHAENEQLTCRLTEQAIADGRARPHDFRAARPVVAENEAIARALLFADETGCALHIVHVTTARRVSPIVAARALS